MTKNSTKTIQEKLHELDEMLEWFNGEDFSLEESIAAFKKAEALATEIEHDLTSIKNEVTLLKTSFDKD